MGYKVNEVARIAGVSVRTLHHYDSIGILKPEAVTPAGYRLYSDGDLERLQQILFFRELGFSLKDTGEIIDSAGFDRRKALQSHKALLCKQKERIERMIRTVDRTLSAIEGGVAMSKEEMFKGFDMVEIEKHQAKYAEEAKQRWGNTEAYKESMKRTASYTKEDWAAIMGRQNEIYSRLASLMDKGPADPEVQKVVGEWRALINDNFYESPPEMARGLGDMYVNDQRFTANIDRFRPGLARFMRDAIYVYCGNLGK